MTKIGLPVPPGFTITTRACIYFSENKQHPAGLKEQVQGQMKRLIKESNKSFGASGTGKPLLLLSVRSGAAISMPGMMDTVLNLGLNDDSVLELAHMTGNERFAWDSYRRFIAMFGDVVLGVSHHKFESAIEKLKRSVGASVDTDLTAEHLKQLVADFKVVIQDSIGYLFPQDPWAQLWMAIDAVFASWDNERAVSYRFLNGISHSMGTAVNVQAMVFGNTGDKSGTGVAFTRNPSTGQAHYYGEYLINAQGEDVVAGIRTPSKIEEMQRVWPELYEQLTVAFSQLEKHYKEMQDCEFTIEDGKLFMLQTRKGKRTAAAAVKIAVDMYNEGLMTKDEAILAVDPAAIDQLLHKQLDPEAKKQLKLLGKGLPASPGAAVGAVVFTAKRAVEYKEQGKPCVLVRLETSPDDIMGMHSAEGILTARGGMTSHAAVVARGMGTPCVAGCPVLSFPDTHDNGHSLSECFIDGVCVKEGEFITLDGATGEVLSGKCAVVDVKIEGDYATIMEWADERRELDVKTNADTPRDAAKALEFGAQGIGLVRTEHMFFDEERIGPMREMILAETEQARKIALDKLLPFQMSDFGGLFEVMSGKSVIIRLLDPPLHEFLPHTEADIDSLARSSGISRNKIADTLVAMREQNPMLGFRGCRLGIVNPEITRMQITAIIRAALQVQKAGFNPRPYIEVPLVGNVEEFLILKRLIQTVILEEDPEERILIKIGCMTETPRAALMADEFAPHVDFLSFGTNDLTQMTCGFSRDDSGSFLKEYVRQGIYERDPFVSIDEGGVGKLMKMCVALARAENPHLEIGVCGEHGGDPASVEFCHRIGLTEVSCSPFRVPIARLAAAHAAIKSPRPNSFRVEDAVHSHCKL
uniref:pyruvate, phosphate dikinase n=1 Tax=Mucochytrium quahogii TaxID=96639 RepID=A0A7S2WDL3_9STRA